MIKKITYLIVAIILSGTTYCVAQNGGCVEKISWLSGTWKMQNNETVIVEEWTDKGSTLAGKSYEVKGKDTAISETSSMSCIAGKLVFTFFPVLKDAGDDRKPVNFVLISEDNNTFIFENKSHDFPQRVVYQKLNDHECHAWIEGEEDGEVTKIDFFYKKVNL